MAKRRVPMIRFYIFSFVSTLLIFSTAAGMAQDRTTKIYHFASSQNRADFFSEIIVKQLGNGNRVETVVTFQAGNFRNGSYHFHSPHQQKKTYVFTRYGDAPLISDKKKRYQKKKQWYNKKPTQYAHGTIQPGFQHQCLGPGSNHPEGDFAVRGKRSTC